ncbi:MAG: DUF1592 domain-containing protein [Planctomycetia bacterium]|nr:DUF1592 domain-containing protein [Planctomycetia bacterium]
MRSRCAWPALLIVCLALLAGRFGSHHPSVAPAAEPPADFKVAVGFLEKHCLHCHGEKTQKAGLALHTFRDEKNLLKQRKTWQSVLHMVRAGEMPPKGRPQPTADEQEAFQGSVAAAFARAEKNAKPDPGRVTIRRLNRSEYNNTIRDLVGVDFNPAEDFPSDDIGHGFDNIGDVLSLSPVLMERYLAAAESIMQRAVTPDPPKPPVRRQAARYLEPSGPNVPQDRFRPVGPKDRPLSVEYKLSNDGEYTIRSRVYGQPNGDDPVQAALMVDGKELKTFEIKATQEKGAQRLEFKVHLEPGARRIGIACINEKKDNAKQKLLVENLELEGPADTRPASHRRLLACDAAKPKREQTQEILQRFASKAYRRPTTPNEIERLVKLVEAVEARGGKWEAGVQLAMQAVLVSPKFLFRVELDDRPEAPEARPLDEFQLASRLSYFLWSTMPDEELLELAKKKQLTANLDAQVRRMLKDPKAGELVDNFAMQWLQLRRLQAQTPDARLFPNFNDQLRSAMLRETQLFFEEIVREDRSILTLLDADFTYLNEPLARHYGIADTLGNRQGQKPTKPGGKPIRGREFVRVSLQPGDRGGLLTQASILTVTSNPTRTSPVKRGRWVLEQILGTPPPPPPPDVPELAEEGKAASTGSLRQRMELHRANVACANCHARMDPLGFAFENFDAVGAWRARDGEFAIDSSGVLPDGRSFKGPGELKTILRDKKELFGRCLTEKMLTYALGRGVEYYDTPTINKVTAALEKHDYKFSTLVTEIVKSDPFRLRRGKGPAE